MTDDGPTGLTGLIGTVSTASGVSAATTERLFPLLVVVLVGYLALSLLTRRIGGAGGGSEKASVAAWFLIAALVLGLYLTVR